jgi:hypothetical protein
MLKKIKIPAILVITLLGLSFLPVRDNVDSFQNKVQEHVKLYDKAYEFSDETVSYQGALADIQLTDWAGTVTLKSRQVYHDSKKKAYRKRLFFSFYYYNDNSKVEKVLDSLHHCYPPNCEKITKATKKIAPSGTESIYIFNEHDIASLHVNCAELPADWKEMKKTFINGFKEKSCYIVSCDCDGNVSKVVEID